MATIVAAQSGNFHDTSTWIGSVVPTFGDVANAAAFTVTLAADVDLGAGSLIATNAGAGGFVVTAARTIVAAIIATVRTVLVASHNTGTVTVTGAVNGGSTASQYGINLTGTGVLDVVGNVTGGEWQQRLRHQQQHDRDD